MSEMGRTRQDRQAGGQAGEQASRRSRNWLAREMVDRWKEEKK